MSKTYWKTIEYIGHGYVLQRRVQTGEDAVVNAPEYYDGNTGKWCDPHEAVHHISDVRLPERVIHIKDAENIDDENLLSRELDNPDIE